MSPQTFVRSWLAGWRHLLLPAEAWDRHRFPAMTRLRIAACALIRLPADARCRAAMLVLIAVQLLVMSMAWRMDLGGWQRDLLRMGPGLLVLPWLATARYVAIRAWLQQQHPPNRD